MASRIIPAGFELPNVSGEIFALEQKVYTSAREYRGLIDKVLGETVDAAGNAINDVAGGFFNDVTKGVALVESSVQAAAGFVSQLGTVANAAQPYGAALCAAVQLGSFFRGLFKQNPPPPPPSVAGVTELGKLPLRFPDRAVLSAQVIDGTIADVSSGVVKEIKQNSTSYIKNYIRARAISKAQGKEYLKANESIIGARSIAYFLAYAPYKELFSKDWLGDVSDAELEIIGQMIGWAAPRIQLRMIHVYWGAWRRAFQYDVCRLGACSKPNSQFGYRLVPGLNAWGVADIDHRGDPDLGAGKGGESADTWLAALTSAVYPRPAVAGDVNLYTPVPKSLVADEYERKYWDQHPQLIAHVVGGNVKSFKAEGFYDEPWKVVYPLASHLVMDSWRSGNKRDGVWASTENQIYLANIQAYYDDNLDRIKRKQTAVGVGKFKSGLHKLAAAKEAKKQEEERTKLAMRNATKPFIGTAQYYTAKARAEKMLRAPADKIAAQKASVSKAAGGALAVVAVAIAAAQLRR